MFDLLQITRVNLQTYTINGHVSADFCNDNWKNGDQTRGCILSDHICQINKYQLTHIQLLWERQFEE